MPPQWCVSSAETSLLALEKYIIGDWWQGISSERFLTVKLFLGAVNKASLLTSKNSHYRDIGIAMPYQTTGPSSQESFFWEWPILDASEVGARNPAVGSFFSLSHISQRLAYTLQHSFLKLFGVLILPNVTLDVSAKSLPDESKLTSYFSGFLSWWVWISGGGLALLPSVKGVSFCCAKMSQCWILYM